MNTLKHCTTCKTDKELFEFVRDSQKPGGFRNICKECKNRQARGGRERSKEVKPVKKEVLNLTQRKYFNPEPWSKRERLPDEAPGQLISKMEGVYQPDKTAFYRNDGHKHIKSRGHQC